MDIFKCPQYGHLQQDSENHTAHLSPPPPKKNIHTHPPPHYQALEIAAPEWTKNRLQWTFYGVNKIGTHTHTHTRFMFFKKLKIQLSHFPNPGHA